MQTTIDESTAPWIHGEYNAEANMLKAVADFQRTRIQSREKLARFQPQDSTSGIGRSQDTSTADILIRPAESDASRILQLHDSTSGIGRSQNTSTADVQIRPGESDARRILQPQIQPAESDVRRILQPHDSTSGIGRSQDTSTADVQILPAESDARRILQPLSSPEMGNKEKLSLVDNARCTREECS